MTAFLAILGAYSIQAEYAQHIDPMTDIQSAVVSRSSIDGRAGIGFSCTKEKRSKAFVSYLSGNYLGTGLRPIMFRFDDQEPVSDLWGYRGDAATSDWYLAEKFIEQMSSSKRLRIRVYDRRGYPEEESEFNLEGMGELLSRSVEFCGDGRMIKRLKLVMTPLP